MTIPFKDAILRGYKRWIDFKGRASRAEFWPFMALLVAMEFISAWLKSIEKDSAGNLLILLPLGIFGIVMIWTLIASLAVSIRRFHDIGRSGWWFLLLWIAGPMLGMVAFYLIGIVVMPESEKGIMLGMWVVAMLPFVYQLWLSAKPGDRGDNEYGPDPLSTD